MRKPAVSIVFLWLAVLGVSTAVADDWTAVRLRGGVFALENGAWTQLVRGSVVSDDRVIKSAPGGRITLVRGSETIELGSDTTAQISDRSGFTTVYNHEGTVGIDAEARNVKHFAVQTPFLAAVVKGTAFTVKSSSTASTVTVARGTVEVEDEQNDARVNVAAGEQVSSSPEAPITPDSVVAAPPDAPAPPAPAARQPQVSPSNPSPGNQAVQVNSGQTGDASDEPGNGNSGSSNGDGGGNGNSSSSNGNGGGNGNGNSGSSNGNGGGNGNGNSGSGNGNGGGNGSGNSGSSNGNGGGSGNGNSGSSNGNGGGNGNGNSGSGNGNGGGNGNGNSGSSNGNGGGNGNGNSGSSNGNGGGNGKS
ncbi:FecR domain-containing protein [Devosia naphthalenivorans]|uniref:FecR domain-containing protein n=1 Tax=Devosia naphthalenivorans TaxID=2082392 RepID=UPI000D386702|nr:FecR domain-containing protein [Devosia naphthalenivorans]